MIETKRMIIMSLFDWEQRKFESLIYPEKIKNKNNLQLPAYSISNKNGFIAQTDQFGKDNTYSKTDKKTNYIVNPGAFAYNPARINVGSIGYQNLATPVLVSSLYEVFKTNSQINDLFLIYWFKTDKFFNQIKKYEEGGVRQYYFLDKLLFSEIIIPKDAREQQKISKILKKLDYLFSLQQRKLEQLKLLKRMISLSIYPNFNDRIPIKFNLNSTWNKKKLKNITNYKNGTTHEQHQLLKGKFELINLNSISKEGRLKSSGKYINQQFPTLRKNDIVMILSDIAHGQLIGTSAVIPTNNKYILNQRVASLSPNENLNAVFISKYINLKQRYFKKMAAGMSQINLSKKDVEDFKLWVPNFKEQTKIANLLINFDLIEKNKNKKISYLLNLKKFLLQSLFL